MAITIAQMADALTTTLGAAATVARAESYDELTEGIHDYPMLQVYWQGTANDVSGNDDRTTYRGGVRQKEYTFYCDYYARPRSELAEDNAAVTNGADALEAVLEVQNTKPYFGLAGIKAFRWTGERVAFDYGGTLYAGCRYVLTLRVF